MHNTRYVREIIRKVRKMEILEYVLLAVLLVCAAFIIVAVVLQKSSDEGLSGTIAGGAETFYGKDKSGSSDRMLYRWTLIAAIVFAIAVLAVFVIQPDYANSYSLDAWQEIASDSGWSHLFK